MVRTPLAPVDVPTYSSASFDGTTTGIPWPVSLEAGLPVSPVLELNACLSVEPTIIFGDVNGTTVVPLMFGLGGESLLQPRSSTTPARTSGFGPRWAWGTGCSCGRARTRRWSWQAAGRCRPFPRLSLVRSSPRG